MKPAEIEKFVSDGWVIMDIPDLSFIGEIIAKLEEKAGYKLSQLHYHFNDESFKALHFSLSEFFWQNAFSLKIGKMLLPILKNLIGLDVLVQYMPYLRCARPQKGIDNIGYHKDTQYGQTPYELAVHIPFVDLDDKAALRVISGSHIVSENVFEKSSIDDEEEVVKGSMENRTGRPYAPKRLLVPEGAITKPLFMRVGQVAVFSPALFHGQEINESDVTRVSTDLRFVNPNGKNNLRIGKVHAGYVPVSESPVEYLAAQYYKANVL